MSTLNYESAGVDYGTLDAFKRACQREAATTVSALAKHGLTEPGGIRGESAYLVEGEDEFLAHVEEGLGTKNLVADEMLKLTGKDYYANIGIDTVATIVNDMITTGALPISVAMHAAVGDAKWFENSARAEALARGFAEGCRRSGAVWGGGETPALRGLIGDSIVLAGSAIGRIRPKNRRILGDVKDGDAIIMLASSGVHTNGLTLCRAIADRLPEKYLAKIDDGRSFGEALLDASIIYARFIEALHAAKLRPHYAVHITGHGWRKLMRLESPFVYRIDEVREPPAIFKFIAHAAKLDAREMYATFNMGAGFAVYVDAREADAFVRVARESGYEAWAAGTVLKDGERKAVEIVPLKITFDAESLQVR